ncbi:TPA: hypothetical protein ACKRMM_006091 [Pseudomonas aeruginosa]|jgi:hypothetical protein
MHELDKSVLKRKISWAEIHELFIDISDNFGYTAENYTDELTDLIQLWIEQGYVEIYTKDEDRRYGRVKDSSLGQGAIPLYLGLFHARLIDGDNDPLVVLVFEERINHKNKEISRIASLRFMLDHDDIFGSHESGEKYNSHLMKALRKRVDDFIQQGNQE